MELKIKFIKIRIKRKPKESFKWSQARYSLIFHDSNLSLIFQGVSITGMHINERELKFKILVKIN